MAILRVGRTMLYELRKKGQLRAVTIGSLVHFEMTEVERFIAERREAA